MFIYQCEYIYISLKSLSNGKKNPPKSPKTTKSLFLGMINRSLEFIFLDPLNFHICNYTKKT